MFIGYGNQVSLSTSLFSHVIVMVKRIICLFGIVSTMLSMNLSHASNQNALLGFIDIALRQSDYAYDLIDKLQYSKMDVALAEHRFETKVVPLTTIGFTQGTGSQQLGLEFRREVETGSAIAYGVVGNRLDQDSDYVVENSNNARAFIRVSQGLFRRWGKQYNLADLNAAELRTQKEEISSERSRQALVLDTVQKYYDLLLADQLLEKSRQALGRSQEHLRSAQSRQAVGLVSKVDVYRAELAALDAENGLQNQNRQKQRALDIFRELLRLTNIDEIKIPGKVQKMVPVVSDQWEEELFKARLDWQAYRIDVEVGKIGLFKAERNLTPDIGLSFTLEQKGEGESFQESLELDQTNWSVQLEMLSTFDTFNEESALLRKKMEMAKLRRTGESLRRSITREANDAFLDLVNEDRSHQISIRRLHQAEMALELAQIRYEKGISDNLDVLEAESSYSEAELGISRALTAYNTGAVKLAYSLGVLNPAWVAMSQPQEFEQTALNSNMEQM